jgi:hypothetical protein
LIKELIIVGILTFLFTASLILDFAAIIVWNKHREKLLFQHNLCYRAPDEKIWPHDTYHVCDLRQAKRSSKAFWTEAAKAAA